MKYLGIEIEKPRIGVFDFTGCEGCELQLANNETDLLDFLDLIEIVNFREVSSDKSDDYDIAFVEGSISREDEIERIKDIRTRAKILVAIGSCACFGGVNFLKNRFSIKDVIKEVYGGHKKETAKVTNLSEIVKVDLQIPGCPVSKKEVEKIVVNLVTGAEIRLPGYPVCVECKRDLNICVVEFGKICLGPITRAGCGAVCPSSRIGCMGCRGPAEDANYEYLKHIMLKKGFSKDLFNQKVGFYNAFSGELNNES